MSWGVGTLDNKCIKLLINYLFEEMGDSRTFFRGSMDFLAAVVGQGDHDLG